MKTRVAARRRYASGTGSGPAVEAALSETDKQILNIIGEGAVYGDTQHRITVSSVGLYQIFFNHIIITTNSKINYDKIRY